MSKARRLLLSVGSILLGWALGWLSWNGAIDFGVLFNTIMFCFSPILFLGGVVYFFITLLKGNKTIK